MASRMPLLLVALTLLPTLSAAQDDPAADRPGMSIRVQGGWRQLWGGDVNDAAANNLQWNVFRLSGELVPLQEGDAPEVRRGPEYGVDVVVPLTPRFSLVGGVGWLESSGDGRLIETPRSTAPFSGRSSASLQLRAVPLRLGIQYSFPLSRRLSLLLDGGGGLYITRLQWRQSLEVDNLSQTLSETDVRGHDVGFHGGLSLDVGLTDRIGLVFGIQGVHANIGGLDGSRDGTYDGFSFLEGRNVRRSTRQDGTLGVFEYDDLPITSLLGLVEDRADVVDEFGSIRRPHREASVGLGGLRYAGALRIRWTRADKTGRPGDATTTRGLQEPATATSPSRDWHRVSVRLSGGRRWLRGGDVNDGVDAWVRLFDSRFRDDDAVVFQAGGAGDAAALRRGAEFAADVIVHLTPRVAIVGGVGLIESAGSGTIEDTVVFFGQYESSLRNSTSLRTRAIPVRVGAQYSVPLGSRLSLGMEGGVGLYFTDLSWSHLFDLDGRISRWDSETRGQDLGLHGGVWVDVGISDRFGLVFGAEGAYANVSGLSGFREGKFSYRSPVRDDGTLRFPETTWATQLLIVGNGSWLDERYGPITPGREASVGLGGLRLSVGLRIGL